MLYPLPYLTFCAILAIMAVLIYLHDDDNRYCRNMTIAGFGICLFFFGLRGFVFHDWYNYYPGFEKVSLYNIQHYELFKDYEIGWLIFELICKTIFDNYHFMVFIHSFILLFLLFRFLHRYTDNILLAFIIYLTFDGFAISLNLMRNSLAIAVFLNALPYLNERKPLPYFLLCLLAFTFHYSAIVFFPLYFFLHLNTGKWTYASIFIIGLILYLSNISVFLSLVKLLGINNDFLIQKVEEYSDLSISLKISIGLLERLLTGLLIFCYYERIRNFLNNSLFINAFLLYILSVFLLSEFSEISKRISILFEFSYCVLWVYIIKCFYYSNNRKLFIAFITIYAILKISTPMINQPVYEYDNIIIGGSKSYHERKMIFDRTYDDEK